MNLKKPSAVFFDWDGTLVDSFRFLHGAHNHVREILGFEPFSLQNFEHYFGQPREKLYTELYGVHREEAKMHFEAYVLAHHLEGLNPMPGALELLEILEDLKIPCGVVSNKKGVFIQQEVRNFGWEKFFVSLVGAGEAEADKPSAAPLRLALERAGLENDIENVWYVGDTDNDLACAGGAGAVSVLIAGKSEYIRLSEQYKIHLHCQNCPELRDFLLQYQANRLKLGQNSGNNKA